MVGAILSMNSVFIVICSYFLFKEKLTLIKYLSLGTLVTAVILVSLFPPYNPEIITSTINEDGGSGQA